MSLNNEVLTAIAARRSCRAYRPEQITREELDAVLTAGTWAPTAMNRQSPMLIAIQDPATRGELSKLNAAVMNSENDPFYGAPTVVVVLADAANANAIKDGSLVMGNLLLAAHSLGLGSCWINRADESLHSEAGRALLEKWGFDPDAVVGVGNCVLGYPADGGVKPAAPRKPDYIHYV